MVGFLKDLFNTPLKTKPPLYPSPMGVRIGAAVEVDPLYLQMTTDGMLFQSPAATLMITGYGSVDLDEGSTALRYYTDDHVMLQFLCQGGTQEQHIREATLYVPHDSRYPHGAGAWREWTGDGGHIGAKTFVPDAETVYQRVWFEEEAGWAPPVQFTETVISDPDQPSGRQIAQTVMLYARRVGDPPRPEFLLLSKEDNGTEATVEIMLGVDLPRTAFKVI